MAVAEESDQWIFDNQLRFCAGWHGRMFVGTTGQAAPISLAAFRRVVTRRYCEAKE